MTDAAADVAATYFDAWKRRDFTRLHTILAEDVTFDGPLGHAASAEECIAGLKRMSEIVTDNGKITAIRVTFGPRPLTSGG